MPLSPGVSYLARTLPAALLPSAAVYVALNQLQPSGSWLPLLAAVLVQPLLLVGGIVYYLKV